MYLMQSLPADEHVALSQYPRPGMLPTKHPNSDKPKLRNIKIMGYSLRTDIYRYTMWVRFHAQNFSRGKRISIDSINNHINYILNITPFRLARCVWRGVVRPPPGFGRGIEPGAPAAVR